ncbi:hypothetical protein PBY51_024218 [Eleginops maclovinus]|uniref:RGS domain-containing protein n=1 Tax=Eleginops maclovinus TaxID=56733 RepID=A0AAN7XZE5_ELEMC|nr:hypothetical protein PBY51_024218 [Eleginops maclovinus]
MCRGLATLPATCLKSAKDIKYKISFLLQKPEPQTSQSQIKVKSDVAKSGPTAAELKNWKESFNHVLTSEMGRTVFGNFLKSEFSKENLDFWVACEAYKKTAPSKMATRAMQIYQQHVEADAPNEVNLDAATREETRKNVENPCPSCFDEAQQMIYTLMEKDSYRRFLNSKLIQDLCNTKTTAAQEKKEKNSGKNGQPLTGGA